MMPRFDELMGSGERLTEAFRIMGEHGREMADGPIDTLVIRQPITFGPDDEAVKVASTMVTKNIRRLPIVDSGRLAGTVSRADLVLAIIR
jgi:CBS domain-containing protein